MHMTKPSFAKLRRTYSPDEGLELTPKYFVENTRKFSYSPTRCCGFTKTANDTEFFPDKVNSHYQKDHTTIENDSLANYIIISDDDKSNLTVTQNTIGIHGIIIITFTKNRTDNNECKLIASCEYRTNNDSPISEPKLKNIYDSIEKVVEESIDQNNDLKFEANSDTKEIKKMTMIKVKDVASSDKKYTL
ncbi:hypothetical protein HCN44_001329 [Aphidius gifuensis]|uniref:Uncharacterized protein n=1 Tax=Aphidius gifuensis TaxID=684658 RepID=A0A834XKX7_APHGI|nr:hypothetical protein HCN44_001329 [Aphidius gifuensis]